MSGGADPADGPGGEAAHVDVLVVDWHGRLRGKRLPMAQRGKLEAGETRLPLSTQAQDLGGDDRDELTGLSLSIGDPDGLCLVAPHTFRTQPWNPRAAQVLASLHETDGAPSPFDSRAVLARQVARFHARGWRPVVAVELEFYLLDASTRESGRPAVPERLRVAGAHADSQLCEPRALDRIEGVLERIDDYARALGLPVETSLAEIGPGQFEINLAHRDDPVRAADEALLFRRVVDRAAFEAGLLATFMAKPYTEHGGSGQHVHASVLDEAGDNLFDAGDGEPVRLRHAVAGLLDTLDDVQLSSPRTATPTAACSRAGSRRAGPTGGSITAASRSGCPRRADAARGSSTAWPGPTRTPTSCSPRSSPVRSTGSSAARRPRPRRSIRAAAPPRVT